MTENTNVQGDEALELDVARAQEGDRAALESVIRAVQKDVFAVALRFLWHPQDAEDATQEILIRVITGLRGFRGSSRFRTWVYRVATNKLLTMRRQRMEEPTVSFDEFGADLSRGLSDEALTIEDGVEEKLLLEEVKIGCTHAMLICLSRDHRMAYILGEIVELEHREAAMVLEISPAAYRKRLSRARDRVTSFMISRCGLVDSNNPCRCRRRIAPAIALGRVDPAQLKFATSLGRAEKFPQVLSKIRQLEETRRAAALFRSHATPKPSEEFISWLKGVIDEPPEPLVE